MKIYDERTFQSYKEEKKTVKEYCKENEKDERTYYIIDMEYFTMKCLYEDHAPTFKAIEWDERQWNSEISLIYMDKKKVVMII